MKSEPGPDKGKGLMVSMRLGDEVLINDGALRIVFEKRWAGWISLRFLGDKEKFKIVRVNNKKIQRVLL